LARSVGARTSALPPLLEDERKQARRDETINIFVATRNRPSALRRILRRLRGCPSPWQSPLCQWPRTSVQLRSSVRVEHALVSFDCCLDCRPLARRRLSGSRAGGRLPNFVRHAMSNNLALAAVYFGSWHSDRRNARSAVWISTPFEILL